MDAYFFVPLLAFTWIYGLFFSGLTAHFFLTIVESSATMYAQNVDWTRRSFRTMIRDGVDWPDASFIDWFWKGIYLGYIAGISLIPALLISRYFFAGSVWISIIVGIVFWLMFPVSVLSTIISSSRWNAFWPPIFVCYAKRPAQTFMFYCFSFLPLAIVVLTADLIFVHLSKATIAWALALSPIAMAMMFLYARLLGRLALSLSFTMPQETIEEEAPVKRKKKKKRPTHAYDESTRWSMPTQPIDDDVPVGMQPSDLPALETPMDGPVTGYNVDYSGAPAPEVKPKSPTIMRFDDDDDTPITVAPAEEVNTPERQRVTDALAEPPEHVMKLYRRDRPEEPVNPFGTAAFAFMADQTTLAMWVMGAVGLAVFAVLMRMLEALRPI